MAAAKRKQHGFRVTATVLIPYDPTLPHTITAASEKANTLSKTLEGVGAVVEKISNPMAAQRAIEEL